MFIGGRLAHDSKDGTPLDRPTHRGPDDRLRGALGVRHEREHLLLVQQPIRVGSGRERCTGRRVEQHAIAHRYGEGDATIATVVTVSAPCDRVTQEIIARSRTFVRIMTQYQERTGRPAVTFDAFDPTHADYVVRTLAHEHCAHGAHGLSVALKLLDEVYRMARWLKQQRPDGEPLIGPDACEPRARWKVVATKEWVKLVGPLGKPKRPRHTRAEMRALFAALDDPRGRLATLLSHGSRLALYAGRRWSHLRLEATSRCPYGGILVDEGTGHEYVRGLTAHQRALLDEALATGYLRAYEAARLRGDLQDYPIFGDGPLQMLPEDPTGSTAALSVVPHSVALTEHGPNVLTIDPRIRLVVELGAALRLGQVCRTMRSQVDMSALLLSPDAEDLEDGELIPALGRVDVQGSGNKQAPGLVLNTITRRALDDAFLGYLSEFEALYQAGTIEDYPLCPGGRLRRGITAPDGRHSGTPAGRDTISTWFHEFEAAAGVERQPGRGWYGLRRVYTDLAPKHTANERTLNTVSGTSTAMRKRYQEEESVEAQIDAARVTEAIRTARRPARATAGGPVPEPGGATPHRVLRVHAGRARARARVPGPHAAARRTRHRALAPDVDGNGCAPGGPLRGP